MIWEYLSMPVGLQPKFDSWPERCVKLFFFMNSAKSQPEVFSWLLSQWPHSCKILSINLRPTEQSYLIRKHFKSSKRSQNQVLSSSDLSLGAAPHQDFGVAFSFWNRGYIHAYMIYNDCSCSFPAKTNNLEGQKQ